MRGHGFTLIYVRTIRARLARFVRRLAQIAERSFDRVVVDNGSIAMQEHEVAVERLYVAFGIGDSLLRGRQWPYERFLPCWQPGTDLIGSHIEGAQACPLPTD